MENVRKKRHIVLDWGRCPPRVPLVLPTANILRRQILNGILRYAQQHGPRKFHMITGLFDEQGICRTREWGCTGSISFADVNAQIQAVLTANVPAVFINPPRSMLRKGSPLMRHCCALRDHAAVGRTGADYFIERQYTPFAYLGNVTNKAWSRERRDGCVQAVGKMGYRCEVYTGLSAEERVGFAVESRRLRHWLRRRPKPVALMAAHDQRARQALDMCMDQGLSVPHDVAVLAAYVNLSGRMLEIRTKGAIGRTINEEIQRARLGAARSMLRNTRKTVGEVAAAGGFYDARHLGFWSRKIRSYSAGGFPQKFRENRHETSSGVAA